jgi:hypothetical protein
MLGDSHLCLGAIMVRDTETAESYDFYQHDPMRHRYLAREILKCPPFDPLDGRLLPAKAEVFYRKEGELVTEGTAISSIRDIIRPSIITIALPAGFDDKYGEGLDGPDVASMAAGALHWYLGVPFDQFVAGHAFNGDELKAHMIMMNKEAYLNMAKAALMQLADSSKGADLIGLKNADIYRNALRDCESNASQVVRNLLRHARLGKMDMEKLQRSATESENFEFMVHLKSQSKKRGATPSL